MEKLALVCTAKGPGHCLVQTDTDRGRRGKSKADCQAMQRPFSRQSVQFILWGVPSHLFWHYSAKSA